MCSMGCSRLSDQLLLSMKNGSSHARRTKPELEIARNMGNTTMHLEIVIVRFDAVTKNAGARLAADSSAPLGHTFQGR